MRQRAKLLLSALAMTLVAAVSAIVIPQIANAGVSGPVGNGPMVFQSGTYTPTITGSWNVTSSTADSFHYKRVGDVVEVSGRLWFRSTATGGTGTGVYLTVPIASDFTSDNDVVGNGVYNSNWKMDPMVASANTAGDTALFTLYSYANNTSDQFGAQVHFTYVVR